MDKTTFEFSTFGGAISGSGDSGTGGKDPTIGYRLAIMPPRDYGVVMTIVFVSHLGWAGISLPRILGKKHEIWRCIGRKYSPMTKTLFSRTAIELSLNP